MSKSPDYIPRWRRILVDRLNRTGRVAVETVTAPLLERGGPLTQLLLTPLVLYFLFRITGSGDAVADEVATRASAVLAAVCWFPVWLLLNCLLAFPRAIAEEKAEGVWVDRSFIFHEPVTLLTTRVTSTHNDLAQPFKVAPFRGSGWVSLLVETDQWQQVFTQVSERAQPETALWDGVERNRSWVWVPANRKLYLHTRAAHTGNPTVVRVKLIAADYPERRIKV